MVKLVASKRPENRCGECQPPGLLTRYRLAHIKARYPKTHRLLDVAGTRVVSGNTKPDVFKILFLQHLLKRLQRPFAQPLSLARVEDMKIIDKCSA